MRPIRLFSAFALTLAALHPAPAPAADATDLSTVRLGKHVMGPAVSPESLIGKVVMVEFWGKG